MAEMRGGLAYDDWAGELRDEAAGSAAMRAREDIDGDYAAQELGPSGARRARAGGGAGSGRRVGIGNRVRLGGRGLRVPRHDSGRARRASLRSAQAMFVALASGLVAPLVTVTRIGERPMARKGAFVNGENHLIEGLVLVEPMSMALPSGRTVSVARATAQFAAWPGPVTIHTWGNKPVLDVDGEQTFAEVAILRAFQRAGWSAKWLEAYNAAKDWPIVLDRWHPSGITSCESVDLGSQEIGDLLRTIIQANGGSCRGCWDVLAWKGTRVVFAEAKRRSKDRINDNQRRFVEAALSVGVSADTFLIVEWTPASSVADARRGALVPPPQVPSTRRSEQPKATPMSDEKEAGDTPKSAATEVQIFKTHAEWRTWYVAHPNGHFFNAKRNMIHRVGCPHYKINEDVEEYFKSPKPCHASRSALSIWVLETRGTPPKRCSSCQ